MRRRELKYSICIVAAYFGELPWYINYYIHSCKFNPTIDFIIVTDQPIDYPLPLNVRQIHLTLKGVNRLASERLKFKTNIQTGYKFCDFKPAYALLFDDLVKPYDFWGQSDIDVIFGDIRNFANDEMLSSYDYISVRHDIPSGCFSLFRNNLFMNELFKRSIDYRKVMSSEENFCFDECNYAHNYIALGKSIFDSPCEIESFMHVIKAAEEKSEIRVHFDLLMLDGTKGRIRFENGKLIYRDLFEAILYHLIDFKKHYKCSIPPLYIPDRYRISASHIYSF